MHTKHFSHNLLFYFIFFGIQCPKLMTSYQSKIINKHNVLQAQCKNFELRPGRQPVILSQYPGGVMMTTEGMVLSTTTRERQSLKDYIILKAIKFVIEYPTETPCIILIDLQFPLIHSSVRPGSNTLLTCRV